MSVPNNQDLKDYECKRGKITQRPPISYAQYRYKKWLVEPDKFKVKLLGGDTFLVELMGDASNAETYMKWYLQCPPHQCVDNLGSHTCGWSARHSCHTLSMM